MAHPDPNLPILKLSRRPVPVDGRRDTLPLLVGRLLAHLERIGADGPRPSGDDPSSARWEDERYVYLEADAPGYDGLEADISVERGRVFVRVRRSVAERG